LPGQCHHSELLQRVGNDLCTLVIHLQRSLEVLIDEHFECLKHPENGLLADLAAAANAIIEIAMEAAEAGHLVMSTLHTIDASKTVERIAGLFPLAEQHIIRNRLAKSFRYIISQRLIPLKSGAGRVAALEILKSTLRTREYVEKGEGEGKTLLDAMRIGTTEGMQHFDGEIEKLIRAGIIDFETGMAYATNAGNLRLELADFAESTRADGTPGA
jgi:twitching motility protein PilT